MHVALTHTDNQPFHIIEIHDSKFVRDIFANEMPLT